MGSRRCFTTCCARRDRQADFSARNARRSPSSIRRATLAFLHPDRAGLRFPEDTTRRQRLGGAQLRPDQGRSRHRRGQQPGPAASSSRAIPTRTTGSTCRRASSCRSATCRGPTLVHDLPFESRVEFSQPRFGKDGISRLSQRANAFAWPSLVRVGAGGGAPVGGGLRHRGLDRHVEPETLPVGPASAEPGLALQHKRQERGA